ncbi:MAG TPA: hypothetical protein VGR16_09440 [Thermomicrobiales bacterium]|nr:hypothetical protein [Thermomicrobiales bacterium]
MATDREYFKALSSSGDAIRIRFTTDRGQVIRYTAQYETLLDGVVRPVVRYDNAHGQAHNDVLDGHGETVRKEWLTEMSGGEALTHAIMEIEAGWPEMRDAFLRRKS